MDSTIQKGEVSRAQTENKQRLNLAGLTGILGIATGLWLLVAPFLLGYSDNSTASINEWGCGGALVVLCGLCVALLNRPRLEPLQWVAGGLAVLVSAWLFISPFMLDFRTTSGAMWNDFLSGVSSAVIAAAAMVYTGAIEYDEDNVGNIEEVGYN